MPASSRTAGDLAMRFSRYSEARGVDPADQFAPVSGPISFSFAADVARGFFVEIANGGELRRPSAARSA